MKSIIIDRLIEIEQSAHNITEGVLEEKMNLPVLIQQKCAKIENRLKQQHEKKEREVKEAKQKECRAKLSAIEKDFLARRKKLDDYFNKNHKSWENDIFDAIIRR